MICNIYGYQGTMVTDQKSENLTILEWFLPILAALLIRFINVQLQICIFYVIKQVFNITLRV